MYYPWLTHPTSCAVFFFSWNICRILSATFNYSILHLGPQSLPRIAESDNYDNFHTHRHVQEITTDLNIFLTCIQTGNPINTHCLFTRETFFT